jgi:hypothetical protein
MKLIPSKAELKFAILMSLFTTFVVTFVLVFVNIGFHNHFTFIWIRSWFIAFVMVGLSILYVGPIIKQILSK